MEFKLKTPVTLGERTIDSLNFKKPKVRDFLRVDGIELNTVESDLALLSSLTGEPVELLGIIELDDWADIRIELAKIWQAFFGIKKKESPQIIAENS